MSRTLLLLTHLLACTASTPGVDGASPGLAENVDEDGVEHVGDSCGVDSGIDTSDVTADDTADDTNGDTDGEVATWPEACDDIYDPDHLPEFNLTVSEVQWRGFERDCNQGVQRYRPVEFSYDGETVPAMARLKGNWSWSCEKYQFVISFNEADAKGRFHGLRKIMLDAPWYDQTLLHERIAFPLFASLGLPYSCVNNARLKINDAYYGVYTNVERIDHEYLERNFEAPDGNLYQAGTELKTNEEENDTRDLEALQAATTVEQLDAVMDLDQAVAEWAAEAMLPAMDNYWAGVEINYYLYDDPTRGFVYLPYDLDLSFGDGAYTDGTLVWPDAVSADPITWQHPGWLKEPLLQRVLADPAWCERFVEAVANARAAFVPEEMAAQVEAWDTQIANAMAADERRPYSMEAHEASVGQLQAFFTARAAFVDAWLERGGHCPVRW